MRVLTNILNEDHAAGGMILLVIVRRQPVQCVEKTLDPRKKDGFVRMMETMERRQEKRYTSRLSEEEELRAHNFI